MMWYGYHSLWCWKHIFRLESALPPFTDGRIAFEIDPNIDINSTALLDMISETAKAPATSNQTNVLTISDVHSPVFICSRRKSVCGTHCAVSTNCLASHPADFLDEELGSGPMWPGTRLQLLFHYLSPWFFVHVWHTSKPINTRVVHRRLWAIEPYGSGSISRTEMF